MAHWQNIWRFDTPNYRVDLDISPCEEDPRETFEFAEDIKAIESGEIDYFNARCVVYRGSGHHELEIVGEDYLGACTEKDAADFVSTHRDKDPMNRNCSIMRAARGNNVVVCHYFPSMVAEAIAEARMRICR